MKQGLGMRVRDVASIVVLISTAVVAQIGAPQSAMQQQRNNAAREHWQIAGRRTPGVSAAALRHRALQQKVLMRGARALSAPTGGISGAWVSLGPLPLPSDASGIGLQDYNWVSGRATTVAIDPNDPSGNTVYAGGAYGGVWRSTNAGNLSPSPVAVNWTPLTDNQATLAIGAIAIQKQLANPNPANSVVLAGTGETNSSGDSYYGLGILRSADGGQTWTLIPQDSTGTHSFSGLGFSQISFSTGNPNLAVAAAGSATEGIVEGLENPVTVNRGLYYSTDAGVSWQAANVNDSGAPTGPASVTSVVYNSVAGMFYAAIRFHGIYSSPDGINWIRLPNQPGTGLNSAVCPAQAVLPSSCPIYRGEIAVVPPPANQPARNEMYAWYVDANDADQGIWQTLNGGTSWTRINDSGIANCGDFFGGCGTTQGGYNLALAAVPNGSATDLYAGATNLYKCTMTVIFPACNGTGTNSFMNLTHVYGCSDIARVHPDQHAIDFLVGNGSALLYFANDGGIYRGLDGYTGLTTGTCGLSNEFDSLNATLGPTSQFVSVSESASDPNLILGGTQDNGAPATAFAQSSGAWLNVNRGDDGFTAVNPSNDNEWFVATPPDSISGVNLFRCSNGINCHSQDFQNDQIADSSAVGGDAGPFYLPFILDPQNSASVLLGTCRIWRRPNASGGFSVLSPDFETGGSGACSGSETNLVRALAAGGVTDANGLSQVIYVGTIGEGPLIPTTPRGGHIWVTTNADGGPTSWADVTQGINPQGFPISSIALDAADPLGKTAYVTIMGFHVSHVWKTTNAGISWTDFTANLPDAPVNSIVIDAGSSLVNGTVYVGTDVGVFASSTGAPGWTEVGPSTGQQGLLPNVAATSLKIFNASGLKRLRAGTYGRGIWEWNLITTPDFQLNVTNNPITVFPGQTAGFGGTIYALNGYNAGVNLSCAAGGTSPPQTCSPAPALVLPTPSGTVFTVNAGDNALDYVFNLHAVGLDPLSMTHDFALTLHVIDFTLSAPSPASVSVAPGSTTSPVSFLVSALGAFNATVTLSCSGLPAGANCQFQPSSSVVPGPGNPVAVTLNISTAAGTRVGTSIVTISASTPGEPAKSQTLTLIVGAVPDYSLAIANSTLVGSVNVPATFDGTLTSANGYGSAVTISCGPIAPPSCVPNPASVIPTSGGTPFTVTVSSSVSQAYSFNIVGVGSDPSAITHSAPVTFTALPRQNFDFTIVSIPPTSASVPAGQAASFSIDVNPTTGTFPSDVTFSCSKLPALTTCVFSPAHVLSGSGDSPVALTIQTTAAIPGPRKAALSIFLFVFPIAGLLWFAQTAQSSARIMNSAAALLLVLLFVSCGGGLQGGGGGNGSPGTPLGTYSIAITATCGSVTHSTPTPLSLTVTP
jgi:hypothetical protein